MGAQPLINPLTRFLMMCCSSDTPLIDHLESSWSDRLATASNTRSLNENELPKKCRFSKNSVLNPQTAHEPSLRLGFLSRTLSYMERYLVGPLTNSLMTKWSMSGVSLQSLTLQYTKAHCNTLQHTVIHCNTSLMSCSLWCVAALAASRLQALQCVAVCCSVLQSVAECCSALHCAAMSGERQAH